MYCPCPSQGFPLGLLNEGPRDSLCGVKGSLIMIQGFVVLKKLKLLPKWESGENLASVCPSHLKKVCVINFS